MDDMNCTPENEDDLEAAEMRFLQKQLELDTKNKESQEEKDYKAEFFELLDEVQLIYSEKATKFEKISLLHLLSRFDIYLVNLSGRFFQNLWPSQKT